MMEIIERIIMITFYIILAGVILLLTIAAMWSARYVAAGVKCTRIRIFLVLFNAISTAAMGWGWGNINEASGIIIHTFSVLVMIELLFIVFVALSVGARYVRRLISAPLISPLDEERRRLLKGAVIYPTAAVAAGFYGGLVEKDDTVVNSFDVPLLNKAHRALNGYRIIQFSDVHCGPFLAPERLEQLLEKAAGLSGDLLVMTGDIFDDNETNEDAIEIIDRYCDKFKDGIIYIFGNHEYFRDLSLIEKGLSRSKVKVLRNQAICIAGKAGTAEALYIVGVDYPRRRDLFSQQVKEYVREAYEAVPEGAASILLAHHPDFIDSGAEEGAAAVLCGHTHGGQIGLFGIPIVPHTFKYMRGIYIVEGKDRKKTLGYVHCGNGSWFPFRLGCPPEIAVFTLQN